MRHREAPSLAEELAAGLSAGQFQLMYQPIKSIPDGRLIGVEALLRWQHP